MRQALHIFRKDVRYLYREIVLMLGMAFLFAGAEALVFIAALYLIARLVHAETIAGDRQFWITRPYRWGSLAGSKVLFVAVFVCVPIGAAQLTMLLKDGFSPVRELPGLLWSQILIFLASLLVVALASVTSGIVPFIFAVLTLATAFFVKEFASPRVAGTTPWPGAIEWLRDYALGIVLTAIAISVILAQYRWRKTARNSAAAIAAVGLCTLAIFFVPVEWALSAQSWFSGRSAVAASIDGSIGPVRVTRTWEQLDALNHTVRLAIPVNVKGVPKGLHAVADGMNVVVEWPGRPAWRSGLRGVNTRSGGDGFDGTVVLPEALFKANLTLPLRVRASLYLTLFGDTESRTIPVRTELVSAQDGLRCRKLEFPAINVGGARLDVGNLECQSFFRWPGKLVYANTGGGEMDFTSLISYSPFPGTLSLNPRERHTAGLQATATAASIITKRPLAHIRKDFVSEITLPGIIRMPFIHGSGIH
jgi:hypothetical protein